MDPILYTEDHWKQHQYAFRVDLALAPGPVGVEGDVLAEDVPVDGGGVEPGDAAPVVRGVEKEDHRAEKGGWRENKNESLGPYKCSDLTCDQVGEEGGGECDQLVGPPPADAPQDVLGVPNPNHRWG